MALFNQCTFIGRLGRDPDLNYTPNGNAVTKFSLAVDQGKDQEPLWLTVVLWGDLAERIGEMVYKGAPVLVQGRLSIRKYKDRQQVERTAVEIVATTVQLLEKKKPETVTPPQDDQPDE